MLADYRHCRWLDIGRIEATLRAFPLFPPASGVTPGRIRIYFFLGNLADDAVYDGGISLRAVLIARG